MLQIVLSCTNLDPARTTFFWHHVDVLHVSGHATIFTRNGACECIKERSNVMSASTEPEVHYLKPNTCSPNSSLPVLIYRCVLPSPTTEESTTTLLTSHNWRKDGTWGHIDYRHFHPNVHECYGVVSGHSRLLLGQGQGDTDGGLEIEVKTGDVIILPAGTAHVCLQSSTSKDTDGEYRYIGVYPENGPHWRSEMGRRPLEETKLDVEVSEVKLPEQDPVYGSDGPLMKLWTGKGD